MSEKEVALGEQDKLDSLYINGVKGNWDFRIFDLVKNPGGTDI